jgi:hypothetical protein
MILQVTFSYLSVHLSPSTAQITGGIIYLLSAKAIQLTMSTGQYTQLLSFLIILKTDCARFVRVTLREFGCWNLAQRRAGKTMAALPAMVLDALHNL